MKENLFYDKSEITNIDWLEYEYWNQHVLGDSAVRASIPDSTVWNNGYSCLWSYIQYYYRHPLFMYYPLVGISKKQAEDYSKWRSDRVFEQVLINNRIIKPDPNQTKSNCFTIERYFAGKYQGVKPDTNFLYYPVYRLPTYDEYRIALKYEDSVEKVAYIHCRIVPCVNDSLVIRPTVQAYSSSRKWRNKIRHIRGNVSEWLSEKNISAGGGWNNSREEILRKDTFNYLSPNSWTGFRNVLEWKKWEKKWILK